MSLQSGAVLLTLQRFAKQRPQVCQAIDGLPLVAQHTRRAVYPLQGPPGNSLCRAIVSPPEEHPGAAAPRQGAAVNRFDGGRRLFAGQQDKPHTAGRMPFRIEAGGQLGKPGVEVLIKDVGATAEPGMGYDDMPRPILPQPDTQRAGRS